MRVGICAERAPQKRCLGHQTDLRKTAVGAWSMTWFGRLSHCAGCMLRLQVPTTVMADVDSSVGGKTGVNHPLGKNMIGAFYQPQCVLIDTDTLSSLPDRELASGLSEVVKYGLIRDPELFEWLEQNMERLLQRDPQVGPLPGLQELGGLGLQAVRLSFGVEGADTLQEFGGLGLPTVCRSFGVDAADSLQDFGGWDCRSFVEVKGFKGWGLQKLFQIVGFGDCRLDSSPLRGPR